MAREIEERLIGTHQLKLGMFVCRLDRPWVGMPFGMQGFRIASIEQIQMLRELCNDVYIDLVKSSGAYTPPQRGKLPLPTEKERIGPLRPTTYVDTATHDEEAPRAREAQQNAEVLASKILADVRAGRALSSQDVVDTVMPIVASVVRSADAFFWVNCLRRRDSYAYSHAITCSALATAFGRHMGFPEKDLVALATGGLLFDIGKAVLPEKLLEHAGPLTDAEFRESRKHVAYSLRILKELGVTEPAIVRMVATHHERYDGSGYPDGLKGSHIPLFGRMAAVIDSFDAMTSERPHKKAQSRHEALQQLYRCSDVLYQREIVEQLTQCLGVYPTGSLVELNTGEVAIVMAQNRARQLRPRVMMLTSADKELNPGFPQFDLMNQAENDPQYQIGIVRVLEPGSYGLDPAELFL